MIEREREKGKESKKAMGKMTQRGVGDSGQDSATISGPLSVVELAASLTASPWRKTE